MLPALTIIISAYCIMRLLWTQEFARVGRDGKPHWAYSVATIPAILIILWQCIEVILASYQNVSLPY